MNTVAPLEVGLVVADLDALVPFYRDLLGFVLLSTIDVPAGTSRAAGLAADGYRVVRLETTSGDRVKLARPVGEEAPSDGRSFAMSKAGGCYLTLIVDDLAKLHARLRAASADIRSEGIVELRPGLRLLLVADPEGNFLEFLQYDDVGAYRPARG